MPPVPRRSLDTPEDAPLLLALGRLHANKGSTSCRPCSAFPAPCSGSARPEEATLKRLAEDQVAGRVRFGWRRDVPALLAAADVFVCPSATSRSAMSC
jgi:hypothetical protein